MYIVVYRPRDTLVRIKQKYPYHVVRKIKGQPDPSKMTHRSWGFFGRVPEEQNVSNRWCFPSEEVRRKFIDTYGGDIPE